MTNAIQQSNRRLSKYSFFVNYDFSRLFYITVRYVTPMLNNTSTRNGEMMTFTCNKCGMRYSNVLRSRTNPDICEGCDPSFYIQRGREITRGPFDGMRGMMLDPVPFDDALYSRLIEGFKIPEMLLDMKETIIEQLLECKKIERCCYSCHGKLSFTDCFNINIVPSSKMRDVKRLVETWKNPVFEFLCCFCYNDNYKWFDKCEQT